jgi:hypothetical protein
LSFGPPQQDNLFDGQIAKGAVMKTGRHQPTFLKLPSPAEAKTAISIYIGTGHIEVVNEAQRQQIIDNSLGPVILLIEAVRLAMDAGPEEEAVLIEFIRSLYTQAEQRRREEHFFNLMAKLSAQGKRRVP